MTSSLSLVTVESDLIEYLKYKITFESQINQLPLPLPLPSKHKVTLPLPLLRQANHFVINYNYHYNYPIPDLYSFFLSSPLLSSKIISQLIRKSCVIPLGLSTSLDHVLCIDRIFKQLLTATGECVSFVTSLLY